MFSEAYIIFSLGLTKPLQKALFPSCFASHADCSTELTHVQNYIQLCGIIVGESLWHGSQDDTEHQHGVSSGRRQLYQAGKAPQHVTCTTKPCCCPSLLPWPSHVG